jgi:hypothetical protein
MINKKKGCQSMPKKTGGEGLAGERAYRYFISISIGCNRQVAIDEEQAIQKRRPEALSKES